MDFVLSEEQLALQDTLQRFVAREYSFEQRRALVKSESGFSREHWSRFAELGILALPFPEDCGGIGGNAIDVMLVMEVLGRRLVLEPYLTTVILCGGLIRDHADIIQKRKLLELIASGELLVAFAHFESGSRYAESRISTMATADGDGWLVSGAKTVVLNGDAADKLIVSAWNGDGESGHQGISLFLVDRNAAGVTVHGYRTQDGGRAAEITLDKVRVAKDALIGVPGAALPAIERALDHANVALCAEAVGAMDALNEATLEYLKTRKQFGVPLGSFQALQHRMADMTIAAELARSMTTLAAVRVDSSDTAERRRTVAAAKAYVGQQSRTVGQQAVQLHGGMGVVDELNVSHYFKRLTMIAATFGDVDHHLARFSDSLLAG